MRLFVVFPYVPGTIALVENGRSMRALAMISIFMGELANKACEKMEIIASARMERPFSTLLTGYCDLLK